MVFPCFTILGIFFLVIRFILKAPSKKIDLEHKAFWAREREANSVRKQPLTDLEYITINLDALPFEDNPTDDYVAGYQDLIRKLADTKVVNLSGISNTDLKLRYGVANLETLTEYDENYLELVRALHRWGEAMDAAGNKDAAIKIFEYAVSIKSDARSDYKYLADVYKERFDIESINKLIETAESIPNNNGKSIAKMLKERDYFSE